MTFKEFVGSGTTGIIGVINTVVVPIIFTLAFAVFIGASRTPLFSKAPMRRLGKKVGSSRSGVLSASWSCFPYGVL